MSELYGHLQEQGAIPDEQEGEDYRQHQNSSREGNANNLHFTLKLDTPCYYWQDSALHAVDLIKGSLAFIWDTDEATSAAGAHTNLDHNEHRWIIFCLPHDGGTSQLFAAAQRDYMVIAGAQDVIPIVYSVQNVWRIYQILGPAKTQNDFGFTDIFSDASFGGVEFGDLFQFNQASSYRSLSLILASAFLTYPGNPSGRLGNGNTVGVSLNQIAGDGNGTILLVVPEGLKALNPPDGSGTITDILATIPIQDGACTHFGVDSVAFGPGQMWWVLYNEWLPDTVPSTHGWEDAVDNIGLVIASQYVLSSPDLVTWTLVRTVYHGAGELQDTVAIGLGPGGAIMLADTYTLSSHIQPSPGIGANLTNWRYAQGSDTPIVVTPDTLDTQASLNRRFDVIGLRSTGYWIGDRYNIPMLAGFGGGENPPFIGLFTEVSDEGGGPIIDALGHKDERGLICACANGDPNILWGVEYSTGDLLHRPGPLGTTWEVLSAGFIPINDTPVLFQWSVRNPGTLLCISGQGGSAQVTSWDGSSKTVGDVFALPINDFNFFENVTSGAFWEAEITRGAEA